MIVPPHCLLGLPILVGSMLVALSGCRAGTAAERQEGNQSAAHEHSAPHGGLLVELGEEFAHVELVLNRREGALTAYVLDGEAEQPIRLSQLTIDVILDVPIPGSALTFGPVASVLTGEGAGDTSQFVIRHDALRISAPISGRLKALTVRGREFRDVPFTIPVDAGAAR
jgi:hypothetical protein